jgi:hypothetical protein
MQWQKQLITLLTASNCLHVPQVGCPDTFSFSRICSACNQMSTLSSLCDAATHSRFKHRSHLCTWISKHTPCQTPSSLCALIIATTIYWFVQPICWFVTLQYSTVSMHAGVTLTLRLQQTGCVVNKPNNGVCLICWLKNDTHIKHILLGYKDQNSNEHPK